MSSKKNHDELLETLVNIGQINKAKEVFFELETRKLQVVQ